MINYIILGIVQGLTEFFPVSSSGHLVILEKIFGLAQNGVAISVILHLGTTLALIIFFFRDIVNLLRNKKMFFYIILATVITGVIGVSAKDFFESLFNYPKYVAFALIFTGSVLLFTRRFMHAGPRQLNIRDAIIFGLAQGLAIVPGISRSGITVSTLLFRKAGWEESFRFSFLASIPVILGASLLETRHIQAIGKSEFINLGAGFIFSFITGILTLYLLKEILRKAKFYYFGYYCFAVALITLVFLGGG
ncbi:undecaprenyl-diphosphate phosphatase [bacterium]|nr:MAG: undecaprenyl-diphosphate phosphatase [bacterium]